MFCTYVYIRPRRSSVYSNTYRLYIHTQYTYTSENFVPTTILEEPENNAILTTTHTFYTLVISWNMRFRYERVYHHIIITRFSRTRRDFEAINDRVFDIYLKFAVCKCQLSVTFARG